MKEIFYTAIVTVSTILFTAGMFYALHNESTLKQLKTGEIKIYNEVYRCQYVGHYENKNVFIPVEIHELPNELYKQLKDIE